MLLAHTYLGCRLREDEGKREREREIFFDTHTHHTIAWFHIAVFLLQTGTIPSGFFGVVLLCLFK